MSAQVLFQVSGMTCGACTSAITGSISSIKGVEDVSVSLLTEEAKITFDSEKVSTETLKEAIEDCGFDASLSKTTNISTGLLNTVVNIQGMTCGACSASITEAVEAIPGVENVSVSLVTESGLVKHSTSVSKERIKQAIEDCGFDAQIESSKPVSNKKGSHAISQSVRETTFAITGMTCGACTGAITEALEKTPHVSKVSVSLITEEAMVTHYDTEITASQIKEIIEDCGFDAEVVKSTSINGSDEIDEDESDDASLQIYGITENTDIEHLQYNIEAYLNSLPGILDFHLAFKTILGRVNAPPMTASNSSTIRSMISPEAGEEIENIIDELMVSYSPNLVGVRQLVDGLNDITDEIRFIIVNSVDQSSASQLKLLSRVKDIQYWKTNFIRCILCGLPVIILSNTQKLPFWNKLLLFPGLYVVSLLELVLAAPVQFKFGAVFIKKFIQFIRNGGRNATMDVLVCISSSVSFIFSIVSLLYSVWYGQESGPPKLLLDTSCMLILFVSFGKWLENKAKGATSTALSKLLSLTPSNCTIVSDTAKYEEYIRSYDTSSEKKHTGSNGTILDFPSRNISIDLIQNNDIAIVLPGGKVPADGVIVFGQSEIDESIITGESLPVYKTRGDHVIGGSINGPDLIHIRVLRAGKRSQLHQIINLVKESQINKAPVQRFSDYIAARFVPTVLILSTITFLFWVLICYNRDKLPEAFVSDENGKFFVCLKIAISVIVVACPCALGLAAPTAIMVGTGIGAMHGVLIKGGDVLEKASSINVILFDKTGTLTTGDMTLLKHKQISSSNLTTDEWWTLVGSVECNSEHPVGKAISKAAKKQLRLNFEGDSFNSAISEFKVLTGLGIKAAVKLSNGKKFDVHVGNHRMVEQLFPHLQEHIREQYSGSLDSLEDSVNTLAYVIINEEFSGFLELTDCLKPNAREVIHYLKSVGGYQVGMVTGDRSAAARRIGREVGISETNIFSEVSPTNKDKVIVDLKERLGGSKNVGIAFVGDGINDAPALAQADIGMAISSGTDIAIESADIVLIGGAEGHADLSGVLNALHISNATFRRIKINFLWAAIYNIIMLPFAMGCFLPFNVILPPVAAAAAMMCSSVSVVLSSLMLKSWKAPKTNGNDVAWKADLESELISDEFSLKDGTLGQFNRVKRNRRSRASSGISMLLRMLRISRRSTAQDRDYELIPATSR
ncbi:copper-transporting ATPase [Scheffersomyces xylosifermentans]|uniref:copper-transporting ATPase n=1 Tax=Scheffersomyces xylosifermentans TaxID=1304137 RepID=UPI00315D982E